VNLAAALTLFAVLILSGCSSGRAVTSSEMTPGSPGLDNARSGEPVTGRTITKELPHAKESATDIEQREAKDPLPPRGDVAIPSHRIQRGDNTVAPPPPSGAPAGSDNPGGATPSRTGGY